MTVEESGQVLSALQLLNQLISPSEDHPLLAKWRGEITRAIALQESEYARLQRGAVEPTPGQEFRPGAASETNTGVVAGPKALRAEPAKSGLTTQAGLAESPNNGRPEGTPLYARVHSMSPALDQPTLYVKHPDGTYSEHPAAEPTGERCRCVREGGTTRFNINCAIHGKAP